MALWRSDIGAEIEPHRILIKRGKLVDDSRNGRVIPFKLYHPVEHDWDKLPVIIWSHGLGGSVDGAGYLARFIASHGYIVINIQHHGTDTSLWEGKPGHPWDIIRATPIPRIDIIKRFQDVDFVVSQLQTATFDFPDVLPFMDVKALGMSGHSFGALTTQVMAGQKFPDHNGTPVSLRNKKFKCGILYSPTPIHTMTKAADKDIYGGLSIPLLYLTGTKDSSPVEGFDYIERLRVFNNSGAPDQYLAIFKDGDHMVFSGSRGQLEENPHRDVHESMIKIMSLAFWEAHLRGDKAAKAWLTNGGLADFAGESADTRYKP